MTTAEEPVDVLVIGAGLSGLKTAVDINRAGFSVLVLEARDRVGGKTFSVRASDKGGVVDLGAAWINDTNQSEMYKLAREFNFDLIEQRVSGLNLRLGSDGQLVKYEYGQLPLATAENQGALEHAFSTINRLVAEAHPEKPEESPQAQLLDSMTLAEFAKQQLKSDVSLSLANTMSLGLLGVEAEELSTLFMVDYLQSGTGVENLASDKKHGGQYLRNRQGNQSFSKNLAALLPPGSIHLSTPVSKIVQSDSGVKVESKIGTTYYAKRVVSSVALPILPSIHFDPPLPAAKKALAEGTVTGYFTKVIFVFDSAWWREAGLSGVMDSQVAEGPITFTRDTSSEADGQYSITCFLAGDQGRRWSKWPAVERRRLVTKHFDTFFGKAAREAGVDVPSPLNIIEQDWTREAWLGGTQALVMTPGVLTSDAGKAIREPFGKVHFVGTDTALVWKGYMEGAVRSGIRGAEEVVKELSQDKS